MTAIVGSTYALRHQLKALGGRWDSAKKCWFVPDDKIEEVAMLIFPLTPRNLAVKMITGQPVNHSPE